MSGLAAAWSDFKESFFSTVAYAEEQDEDVNVEETQADDGETAQQKTKEPAGTQKASTDEASETKDDSDSDDEASDNDSEEASDGDSDDESDDESDDDEDEDDDDDEDEDEDEIKDPLDVLREKYSETVCHSFKHHFDECVERVTKAQEQEGYEDLEHKEDCIEEFFHLQHCLNDHIAPVLFSKLK